jgi:hypothetical protein
MFLDGRMGGWMEVKAVLRIAYSNQKTKNLSLTLKVMKMVKGIRSHLFVTVKDECLKITEQN